MNMDSSSRKRIQAPLRDRLKETASTAILEAAEAVFSEEGFDARMETIATRAGVAVGTLYNHFKDRQALVEAVQDAYRDRIKEMVDAAIEDAKDLPVRDLLLAVVRAIVEGANSASGFRRFMFQSDYPVRASRKREFGKLFMTRLQPVLARAQSEGELRADQVQIHAAFLMGLVHAGLAANLEGVLPLDQVPERIVAQFLHGASKREGR
jgi:AcrR family transcriptional regulator